MDYRHLWSITKLKKKIELVRKKDLHWEVLLNQKGKMQILNELVFEPLICVGLCLLVFGGCELWSMELHKIYKIVQMWISEQS
jgi:hypothetical protein